jgi:hypothetical protein
MTPRLSGANAGGSNGFMFEGSWSAVEDSELQVEAPWGPWDDLTLDLDYTFAPDGLSFAGFDNCS